MDSLLGLFDAPAISFVLGFLFIWAAWLRSRRLAPGSIMAGGGKYIFAIVGVLLLCNGVYQSLRH